MSRTQSEIYLRPTLSSYLIFIVIWGVPLIIFFSSYFVNGNIEWGGIIICLFGMFGSILWLSAYELKIAHDEVIYHSLFGGTVSLPVDSIMKAEFEMGFATFSDRFRPTLRLVLEPDSSTRKKPIIINVKPFDQKDLQAFLAILDSRKNT